MEAEQATELNLVSTGDLIAELASRHSEIIIIREHKKGVDEDNVFVKTGSGKKKRADRGFDLIEAIQMLHAAQWQLTFDYLDNVEEE